MALIVITIRDQEDGSCSVQLTDEPRCVEGQTEFSPAQHIAAAALNAIHAQLNEAPNVAEPNRKQRRLITAGQRRRKIITSLSEADADTNDFDSALD